MLKASKLDFMIKFQEDMTPHPDKDDIDFQNKDPYKLACHNLLLHYPFSNIHTTTQ